VKFNQLPLKGAFTIDIEPNGDERGFFARVFCEREFAAAGIDFEAVQMNMSTNREKGTLRGLHYQLGDNAEQKLVRCIKGAIVDLIVDVRPQSPTFLEHVFVELSEENRRAILVPRGFAHGIQTLTAGAEILYLVSAFYAPGAERGLRWNDPRLAIAWPLEPTVISDKDRAHPDFDPAIHLQ
jgi:dTDP-4-dehydrorhamnose 3,5-epimerase